MKRTIPIIGLLFLIVLFGNGSSSGSITFQMSSQYSGPIWIVKSDRAEANDPVSEIVRINNGIAYVKSYAAFDYWHTEKWLTKDGKEIQSSGEAKDFEVAIRGGLTIRRLRKGKESEFILFFLGTKKEWNEFDQMKMEPFVAE